MQNPNLIVRTVTGLLLRAGHAVAAVRVTFLPLASLFAANLVAPAGAASQQFVTDDAAIVDRRACQLEAWLGQTSSWILPACQFVPRLEITAGVGFGDGGHGGGRHAEYVLQGKYLFRELAPGGLGVGLVAGLGYDPLSQVRGGVEGVFAYVPLSLSLRDHGLILHGNLGWLFERDEHEHNGHVHDEAHHALTWAARADLLLPLAGERFTLIGELFGEDRLRPEFQLGLRSELIAGRLLVDMSWGGHTQRGTNGAGWSFGFAWTPPPLF
jgi:hypothetical protein